MNNYEELIEGFTPTSIRSWELIPVGDFPPDPLPDGTHPQPVTPIPMTIAVPGYTSKYSIRSRSVDGSKRVVKPFTHYKRASKLFNYGFQIRRNSTNWFVSDHGYPPYYSGSYRLQGDYPVTTAVWNSSFFGPAEAPFVGAPPMYSIQDDGTLLVPPPNGLDELLDNAMIRILPGLKPKLSLINSLIELKDFKSIGHSSRNLLDLMQSFGKRVSHLTGEPFFKYAKNHTLRELARKGSDLYLQYKFNIAPLYSDIKGICDSFHAYKRQAQNLVSRSERALTSHVVIDIPSEYPIDEQYSPGLTIEDSFDPNGTSQQSVGAVSVRRFDTSQPVKFHVEVRYSYYWTDFQRRHAVLLSLLDDLGVNFNPAIIWNAIPWSFVVDWLVGIGPWLSKFRVNNMQPVIVIHDALWSVKRTRRTYCVANVGYYPGSSGEPIQTGVIGAPISLVEETAYRRTPFTISGHSVQLSGLSPTEISLGTALLLSRRKRSKR